MVYTTAQVGLGVSLGGILAALLLLLSTILTVVVCVILLIVLLQNFLRPHSHDEFLWALAGIAFISTLLLFVFSPGILWWQLATQILMYLLMFAVELLRRLHSS